MKNIRTNETTGKAETRDYFQGNHEAGNANYNFLGIRGRSQAGSGNMESGDTAPSGVWRV